MIHPLFKTLRRFSLLPALVFALANPAFCSNSKARLYNLKTGEVLNGEFSRGFFHTGHGKIWITLPGGAKLTGEYTTVPNGAAAWGNIYGSVYGTGGSAFGSASSSATAISMQQPGSAIATGSSGEIIECEYLVSAFSGHGSGGCKDKDGNLYRLMF